MSNIFITGTDTNVGKTLCAAVICAFIKQQGKSVAYLKPIETGCENNISSDKSFVSQFIEDTYCLYRLNTPISPHLAARKEGVKISIAEIKQKIAKLSANFEYLVIEGAGGLLVPITEDYDYAIMVSELEMNLILVTGSRLGMLNQARLNFEYIRNKQLNIIGYVYNEMLPKAGEQIVAINTNRAALESISAKYDISELFALPFFDVPPDAKTLIEFVDKGRFSATIRDI